MLEPGDRVRIDGGERTWTIAAVNRRDGKNFYRLEDWPDDTMIPGDRISGVVGWTSAPGRP